MNPIPIDTKPITEIKFIKLNPPLPQIFTRAGSIVSSPDKREVSAGRVKYATKGRINSAKNINVPWKKSDQATAKKPPENIYTTTIPNPIAIPL